MTRLPNVVSVKLTVVLALAAACSGDASDTSCSFRACGGNLVGTWHLVNKCGDPYGPPCPGIVEDNSEARTTGSIVLHADRRYMLSGRHTGVVKATLPRSCTPQFASCAALAGRFRQESGVVSADCVEEPSSSQPACACRVEQDDPFSDEGTYEVTGSQVRLGDGSREDFCVSADVLKVKAAAVAAAMGVEASDGVLVFKRGPAPAAGGPDAAAPADAGPMSDPPLGAPDRCVAAQVGLGGQICVTDPAGSFRCFTRDGSAAQERKLDAPVVELGLGFVHRCARTRAGSVWCWGGAGADDVRLGQGGGASADPVRAALPVDDAVALGVGYDHACVAHKAGGVSCWGRNSSGQLGEGNLPSARPVPVPGLDPDTRFVAVAAGSGHSCALDETGGVWCWGSNSYRQLGHSDLSRSASRIFELRMPGKLALGRDHSCALDGEGTLFCWGLNASRQTGVPVADGPTPPVAGPPATVDRPTKVPILDELVDVAAGDTHTCAVGKTGRVFCWGANAEGQSGEPSRARVDQPFELPMKARAIVARFSGSCAVTPERGLVCWGAAPITDNPAHQLTPAAVKLPTDFKVVALSHAGDLVAALGADGRIQWWGATFIGGFTGQPRAYPGMFPPPITAISVSRGNLCVVGAGAAHCRTPVAMAPLPTEVATVATSNNHACALKLDGTVWCWGSNYSGELGQGAASNNAMTAGMVLQVSTLGTDSARLAAGPYRTCVIKKDGTVWCWGEGVATPTLVTGPPVDEVSLASGRLCARARDGGVWCGSYPTTTMPAPALAAIVDFGNDVKTVSAGSAHTCAVKNDGTVWCRGSASAGALGLGTLDNPPNAVRVPGLEGITAIAAAGTSTCATKADQSVLCWGNDLYGQAGDGTLALPLGPVRLCAKP